MSLMAKKTPPKNSTSIDFRVVIKRWLDKNGHSTYWLTTKCVNQSPSDAEISKKRYYDKSKGVWRKKNVPQTTKSRPLGMTPNSLYRYLRGERDITGEKLSQILSLMGASINVK